MEKNILVVDFGYSFIKAIYKGRTYKEPSIFSFDFEANNSNLISTNNSTYLYEGKPIAIGNNAENKQMKIFSRDISFVFRFYPLVIFHIIKKMGINANKIDYIVVGLPPENLSKENAEALKKRIVSESINNEKIKIPKQKIIVLGQGQGAFIDIKTSNNTLNNITGFLLDIGFNTLIAIPFKNGKILPSFKQYERYGISGLLEEFLRPILKNEKNINIKDIEKLNRAYIKGQIKIDLGKFINIEQQILKAVKNYMEIIIQKIKEDFKEEIIEIDRLILTGGGSYRLKEFLPDELKQIVIVPEQPEFSNARGYLKIAQNLINSN